MRDQSEDQGQEIENPYLIMGFLEFAIISTLAVVFFPWSLLFSLIVFGMEQTKFLVVALLHDLLKTVFAILSVIVSLVVFILILVFLFAG